MTKLQKQQIIIDCLQTGFRVTAAKLSKLEHERKHRRDLDRFIINSPFRKARA